MLRVQRQYFGLWAIYLPSNSAIWSRNQIIVARWVYPVWCVFERDCKKPLGIWAIAFLLCNIDHGGLRIVVGECKQVLFTSKANVCDWPNNIAVDVLVKFGCFRLGVAIVLFFRFCSFVAITDESLYIMDEFDIMMCRYFFRMVRFRWPSFCCYKMRFSLLLYVWSTSCSL